MSLSTRRGSIINNIEDAYQPVTESGCWIWMRALNGFGYGRFWTGEKYILAHRFMYEREYGPVPDGLFVLHRCDVRCCVNPTHLFLGTQADNLADMVGKGRQQRGPRHWKAKLSAEQVLLILADTRMQKVIAKEYGIDPSQVSHIKTGKNWNHVTNTTTGIR